ncbi:50S ribosomal protein L29 [Thermochromatium tepidum]|jgi:LSU ribosomal protein L29P|uniref:Large ribosomal subunit protein uL29 n=1 Tax=Thermochromatium tepidum ATCC 43061 TaxID=316276 RepID=A0A6I6E816_THETI|nr:50S ribosomal protein L29 [Thermochromatium tepidum]QGU32793.1 50S ribosomal protein L29 [Thermochromatium tepidum ATCC 43061]
MKANELRTNSTQELQAQLMELLREQFNLRMQRGTGQLSKPSRMKAVRRDIARIKTIMAERKAGRTS